MFLALVLLGGCQTDPLLALGMVPMPMPLPEPVAVEAPAPAPDALEIPATPGATTAELEMGGAKEMPPVPEGATATPAPSPEFNPISVPQGPREGGGVRWEGVKGRGERLVPIGDRGEFGIQGNGGW